MVRVKLLRVEDGSLGGFVAEGHSGFAARGNDVVCAAVSALTTVTVLGLQARLKLSPRVEVDDDRGYLECRLDPSTIPDALWFRAQDLMETMALGLHEIANDYSKYIQVEEVTP